jgi:hypothetical protein
VEHGEAERSISPMWLAHHSPEEYDRCVAVGRTYVCRRCLVLYPITFAVLMLARAGVRWPTSLDALLILSLSLPTVAEFVLEHIGLIRFRPRRQDALTIPAGVALGVSFDRYLRDHTDLLFWATAVAYSVVGFAAVQLGARLARGRT